MSVYIVPDRKPHDSHLQLENPRYLFLRRAKKWAFRSGTIYENKTYE